MSHMATRLSRVEQVGRNRGMVLDAARQVFLERGYAGATLEAIAEEAGFSKGVVYSQFAGKPDLFLALLERRIAERAAENAEIAATEAGFDGLLALLRAAYARDARDGGNWSLLLIEFRVVAARDAGLNARYTGLHTQTLERLTDAVCAVLARAGLAPVGPPKDFARLLLAIVAGNVLEQAAGTGALPPEALIDVVARLVEPI